MIWISERHMSERGPLTLPVGTTGDNVFQTNQNPSQHQALVSDVLNLGLLSSQQVR